MISEEAAFQRAYGSSERLGELRQPKYQKFHHDFNVEHIARIEAKQLKVSGELENLEKKKKTLTRSSRA